VRALPNLPFETDLRQRASRAGSAAQWRRYNTMISETSLRSEEALVSRLSQRIEGLEISATDRNRISAGCFHLALEHHEAIVHLIRRNLFGSAMALVRPLFETYVRGIWLGKCASESELKEFQKGKIDKTFGELVADIEGHEGYNVGVLAQVKKNSWSAMNDFTHGGVLQVIRRITADSITPNYTAEEIGETVTFAGAIGLLSTSEVALIAGRTDIASELLEEMKNYSQDSSK
jgi:hypothetical protein